MYVSALFYDVIISLNLKGALAVKIMFTDLNQILIFICDILEHMHIQITISLK